MKKRGDKLKITHDVKHVKVFTVLVVALFAISFVSAGVGLSWNQEDVLIFENKETCLTYKVYNPWEADTYGKIILSEEFEDIVTLVDNENKFIPKETSSDAAIPVELCFKAPSVYEKDCLFGSLFCKQECGEEMKAYSGEIQVVEAGLSELMPETSGSTTEMSVSAPLNIKVQCVDHKRSFSLLYVLVMIGALVLLAKNNLATKKKKPSKKKASKKKKKRK